MIEQMKKITLFASEKNRLETISALRDCGVMHIIDLAAKSEEAISEQKALSSLELVLSSLDEKVGKKDKVEDLELDDARFDEMISSSLSAIEEKKMLQDKLLRLKVERDRIAPYGDFLPEDISFLSEKGIKLFFYAAGKKEKEAIALDEENTIITLKEGKQVFFCSVGHPLKKGSGATLFMLPEKGLGELSAEILSSEKRIEELDGILSSFVPYRKMVRKAISKRKENIVFERAKSTLLNDDGIIHITGYVPASMQQDFKDCAKENGWAYLIDDPSDEDNPPTLIKYKGFVRIVKPVFDILGTVPGYRESDISSYFLVFFSLFFAMIVGDAGYGLIFLLVGIFMNIRSKKASDLNILVYVLSITTIVWGALTGTWFGSAAILEGFPFLQRLVIPAITNFPEVMGVDADWAQNMVMKFCFILGAVQLSLACVLNIIHKVPKKDLSWVADLGWLIDVILLYFLVLYLVIGAECNFQAVVIGVSIGFVLVCVFGAQAPGVPFAEGLKAGLGGFFTTFLNTVSCFSNIMSYIRLFAVGMASLAIAQSFNDMGAGLLGGVTIPLGLLVILVGHALNLVMGLLSVVVHGVRLNLLEFSGQLGMEWSGYNYEPFKKTAE